MERQTFPTWGILSYMGFDFRKSAMAVLVKEFSKLGSTSQERLCYLAGWLAGCKNPEIELNVCKTMIINLVSNNMSCIFETRLV